MTKQAIINLITETIYNNTLRSSYMETMPIAEKVLLVLENANLINYDLTEEELLAEGICPCGNTDYTNCAVTGCALYCYEEFK